MRERGEEEGIESCRCCHGYLACARGGGRHRNLAPYPEPGGSYADELGRLFSATGMGV